ncbi:MAG: hypothetical protein ACYC3I_08025 [Gemmataceae bacterium]
MMLTKHCNLVLAALAVFLSPWTILSCRGQQGSTSVAAQMSVDTPSAVPDAAEVLPPPQQVMDRPETFVLPPPPNYSAVDGPLNSPWLDRPEAAPPGCFFNVESSVVWPDFHSQLQGGRVTLAQTSGVAVNSSVGLPPGAGMPITGDIVSFPYNRLNPTVTPRFELGYRFADGFGELRLSYRCMDTSGSDTVLIGYLGPAAQKGSLDVEFIDLDYATREFSLPAGWEMRPAVGLRLATSFLDSQVNFLNPVTIQEQPFGLAPFTRLTQYESVSSQLIGIHAVLEVARRLGDSGMALFGRVEGAGMYGRTHQTFAETFVESPGSTSTRIANVLGAPIVATQVGLSYDVPRWKHTRFLIGYQFESFWQFGRGNNDVSFGTLTDQGLFLRGEFNF